MNQAKNTLEKLFEEGSGDYKCGFNDGKEYQKISSLTSDIQWIDVKEDPGQAGEYLIFDPEDSRCTDYFIRGKWEYTNPTHWMPLPTPPNN